MTLPRPLIAVLAPLASAALLLSALSPAQAAPLAPGGGVRAGLTTAASGIINARSASVAPFASVTDPDGTVWETHTRQVTKTRNVVKTRTVVKTRPVTKTRTVTKTRQENRTRTEVRTTAALRLRATPSAKARTLTTLKKNTLVKASTIKQSWRKASVGKRTGWVAKRYLKSAKVNYKATVKYTVKEQYKSTEKYTAQEKYTVTEQYTVTETYRVQVLPAPAVPKSFTVSGAGWGHGVGMSQYGAQGMAKQGFTSEQILEHYYKPAQLTTSASYAASDIKVQLLKAATASVIPTGGQVRLLKAGKIVASGTGTVAASVGVDPADASKTKQLKVRFGAKDYYGPVQLQWQSTRAWSAGPLTTVAVPRANEGSGTVNYRHGVIHVDVLGGQVNVINQLRLNDEYLYGLAEMPSSWESAALQSQAIAGRTYAMRNMTSVKSACACNVYDEVASQKFTGWNKENEGPGASYGKKWVAAVNATLTKASTGVPTAGKVMMYAGKLIDATYFSSSGGSTRSGKAVWGGDTPYLQPRNDAWALPPYVSSTAWSTAVPQATMSKAFGLSNVVSVTLKFNEPKNLADKSKNPDADTSNITLTAKDRAGKSVSLSGSSFRSKIGGTRSAWIQAVKAG